MTTYVNPMTKLQAVNICLSSMGEPPISTLDSAAPDAQVISDIIDETSRSVQAIGWHWNIEKYILSPNTNNELVLPNNTLRVDSVDTSSDIDVIQRGLRLFNRTDNAYTFTDPITVEVFVGLPFDDLPFAAKQYIALAAARIAQQRLLGSDSLYKFNVQDEQRAWLNLLRDESDVSDRNMLYDSYSTSSMLMRGAFSRGVI